VNYGILLAYVLVSVQSDLILSVFSVSEMNCIPGFQYHSADELIE